MKPSPDSPAALPPPPRHEVALALGLLFCGTLLLAMIARLLPWLSGFLQALLAGLLLLVPGFVLRRGPTHIDDLGVDIGPWRRTTLVSLATMAVIFPLFTLGHDLAQTTLLGADRAWTTDTLFRWQEDLRDPPPEPCAAIRDTTQVWARGDALWIVSPPGRPLSARLDPPPAPNAARLVRCDAKGRPLAAARANPEADGTLHAPVGGGLRISLNGVDSFRLQLTSDGAPLPTDALKLGAWARAPDTAGLVEGHRSLWWLLAFLIVHLGLVAFPEEWFFRGYLQARLDQRFGTPWRVAGVNIGWGVVLSALAFAVLHPILIPGAYRLLVFFPGLLFGWLRARTGNIGAAIVVHASSNLLLAIISRMYLYPG